VANQWLRLWHDMPTDPKWRTIARHSKQPVSLVQAIYIHLLVDASRNVTRGHATVTAEDLASALDVEDSSIQAVFDAMQGRVLDGMTLSGWDIRQPKREEPGVGESPAKTAAQRKQDQRAREKEAQEQAESRQCHAESRQCHAESRNVTTDKDKEEDKELEEAKASMSKSKIPTCPREEVIALYHEVLPELPGVRVMDAKREKAISEFWKWVLTSNKPDGTRRAEDAESAMAWIRAYFERARANDFIMGRGSRTEEHKNWRCSIEYLLSTRGMKKVIEETTT